MGRRRRIACTSPNISEYSITRELLLQYFCLLIICHALPIGNNLFGFPSPTSARLPAASIFVARGGSVVSRWRLLALPPRHDTATPRYIFNASPPLGPQSSLEHRESYSIIE